MAAASAANKLNLVNTANHNFPAESFPPCPASGAGVHCWELATANRCRAIGMTESEAVRFITDRITRPPSPANEVRTAVANAYSNPITEIKFDPLKPAASANQITKLRTWRQGFGELLRSRAKRTVHLISELSW
jgi:hypothetical protein